MTSPPTVSRSEDSEFSLLETLTGAATGPRSEATSAGDGTPAPRCASCGQDLVEKKNGSFTCVSCGEENRKRIEYDQEWRYTSKGSNVRDGGRCQFRMNSEGGIYPDVEHMGFEQSIVETANELYREVTRGSIYRGARRRAIVFACIFHAFKLSAVAPPERGTQKRKAGDMSTSGAFSTLTNTFGITQKAALQGLKYVKLNSPKTSPIHTTRVTIATLVEGMLNQFGVPPDEREELFQICRDIDNKSSRLNRSRPQSVAAGVIYFWICKKEKPVKIDEFGKFAGLSELTIHKLAKEIGSLLGEEYVVDKRRRRVATEPSKKRRRRPQTRGD